MLFFTLSEYGKSIKFWNFKVGQGVYACMYPPIVSPPPSEGSHRPRPSLWPEPWTAKFLGGHRLSRKVCPGLSGRQRGCLRPRAHHHDQTQPCLPPAVPAHRSFQVLKSYLRERRFVPSISLADLPSYIKMTWWHIRKWSALAEPLLKENLYAVKCWRQW